MNFETVPLFKYLDQHPFLLRFISLDAARAPTALPESMNFESYQYNVRKDTFSRLNDIKKLNDAILNRSPIVTVKRTDFLPQNFGMQYHRLKYIEIKVRRLIDKFNTCFMRYAECLMHIFSIENMIPPNFVLRINTERLSGHFAAQLNRITLLQNLHRSESKIFEISLTRRQLTFPDQQRTLLSILKEVACSADQSLLFFCPTPLQESFESLILMKDSPCRAELIELFTNFSKLTPKNVTQRIVCLIDLTFKKFKFPRDLQSYLVPLFFRMVFNEVYPQVAFLNPRSDMLCESIYKSYPSFASIYCGCATKSNSVSCLNGYGETPTSSSFMSAPITASASSNFRNNTNNLNNINNVNTSNNEGNVNYSNNMNDANNNGYYSYSYDENKKTNVNSKNSKDKYSVIPLPNAVPGGTKPAVGGAAVKGGGSEGGQTMRLTPLNKCTSYDSINKYRAQASATNAKPMKTIDTTNKNIVNNVSNKINDKIECKDNYKFIANDTDKDIKNDKDKIDDTDKDKVNNKDKGNDKDKVNDKDKDSNKESAIFNDAEKVKTDKYMLKDSINSLKVIEISEYDYDEKSSDSERNFCLSTSSLCAGSRVSNFCSPSSSSSCSDFSFVFIDNVIEQLRGLTVDDLQPPLNFCPPMADGCSIPADIFKRDPNYSLAVEQIEFISFFTNPLDILHHVHYALHELEISAAIYSKEPNEGLLPFDVVFGLLICVILASDVPEFLRIAAFATVYAPQYGLCAEFAFALAKIKTASLHLKDLLEKRRNEMIE